MRTVIFYCAKILRTPFEWLAERQELAERKRNIAEFNQFRLKEAQRHERLRERRLQRKLEQERERERQS